MNKAQLEAGKTITTKIEDLKSKLEFANKIVQSKEEITVAIYPRNSANINCGKDLAPIEAELLLFMYIEKVKSKIEKLTQEFEKL